MFSIGLNIDSKIFIRRFPEDKRKSIKVFDELSKTIKKKGRINKMFK